MRSVSRGGATGGSRTLHRRRGRDLPPPPILVVSPLRLCRRRRRRRRRHLPVVVVVVAAPSALRPSLFSSSSSSSSSDSSSRGLLRTAARNSALPYSNWHSAASGLASPNAARDSSRRAAKISMASSWGEGEGGGLPPFTMATAAPPPSSMSPVSHWPLRSALASRKRGSAAIVAIVLIKKISVTPRQARQGRSSQQCYCYN